jgi:hypothetical protein
LLAVRSSESFAEKIQSLDIEDYIQLLENIYGNLLREFDGVSAVEKSILSTIEDASSQTKTEISEICKDILNGVCDLSHVKCATLIQSRLNVNNKLSLTQFTKLHNTNLTFISQTELKCNKKCFALRSALLTQVHTCTLL